MQSFPPYPVAQTSQTVEEAHSKQRVLIVVQRVQYPAASMKYPVMQVVHVDAASYPVAQLLQRAPVKPIEQTVHCVGLVHLLQLALTLTVQAVQTTSINPDVPALT